MTKKDKKRLIELMIELGRLSKRKDEVMIEIEEIIEKELDD